MSSSLKPNSIRAASPRTGSDHRRSRTSFAELDVVRLRAPAETFDGLPVSPGATGTIVHVWNNGAALDVEFTNPAGVASLKPDDLQLA